MRYNMVQKVCFRAGGDSPPAVKARDRYMRSMYR